MVGVRRSSLSPSLLLLLLLFTLHPAWSTKERPVRQFNAGNDAAYSSSSSYSQGGSNFVPSINVKECPKDQHVDNARVRCSYTGCRVRCDRGYKLSNGRSSAVVRCDHHTGQLTLGGHPWSPVFTPCLPQCGSTGCLNGGECESPGTCRCAAGFTGDHCQNGRMQADQPSQQLSNAACPAPRFPMVHADVEWSEGDQQALVRCHPGYSFTIGGTTATISCRAGTWDLPPSPFQLGGPLACHSECEPPCENGGSCLAGGVCDCATNFWGPQCQLERCDFPRTRLEHSSLGGTLFRLKVECHPGYKMRNGRVWQTMVCKNGEWTLPNLGPMKDNDLNCYAEVVQSV
ncbi:hypothetical protein Pmani_031130 [Petrolisthes manimaculis]|uniref:EGF-like domain-containing protein n=1 Tax=Petrolisthes manimaculis TaxID=1843537 RepID=A0AAE1NWJ7_9EUCA|nr:hypothetical protein Pmani_031130 [Petrolisthes manimaculis]